LVDANTLLARFAGPTLFARHSGNDLHALADAVAGGATSHLNNFSRNLVANDLRWLEAWVSVMENLCVCSAGRAGLNSNLELIGRRAWGVNLNDI
jgi:hypothetical protein